MRHGEEGTHYNCVKHSDGSHGCCACSPNPEGCEWDTQPLGMSGEEKVTMLLSADTIRDLVKNATKGPWRIPEPDETDWEKVFVYGPNHEWVCHACCCGGPDKGSADAAFIASAPDLAETCLSLYDRVAELEKEVDRLNHLHKLDHSLADQWQRKVEELEQRGTGCLWDGMPETFPGSGMKIAGLVCPCPKCSVRC